MFCRRCGTIMDEYQRLCEECYQDVYEKMDDWTEAVYIDHSLMRERYD